MMDPIMLLTITTIVNSISIILLSLRVSRDR